MLTRKKLFVGVLLFILVAGAVAASTYLYLDNRNDDGSSTSVDEQVEASEEVEDTLPVVSRYQYESVDTILAQDMPTSEKFNKLMSAGSGNFTDEDYDGGVAYIIAALSIADESVDPRSVQGAKDYLVLIANNQDISDESRFSILEVVGQEALDNPSLEDNSNEI